MWAWPTSKTAKIFSVSELNQQTKQLLEQNIPLLWVRGEISNLKCYQSGHWYFTLKDRDAQVRCAMFRQRNAAVRFTPAEGKLVLARARVGLLPGLVLTVRNATEIVLKPVGAIGEGSQ